MSWSRTLAVPLVLAALAEPASAGLFSRKPNKTDPATRVPELQIQLKTSPDEAQRAAAAEELRQYDPKAHPDIIPTLIDALSRDASPAVRAEAATSLGRLRPISQQAGYALEQAQTNDASMRVRLAARQALWQYHLVGYKGGKAPEPAAAAPAASASPALATPASMPRQSAPARPVPGRETPEPPLAAPPPAPTAAATVSRQAPASARLIPANPTRRQPPANGGDSPPQPEPAPSTPDGGPALPPP